VDAALWNGLRGLPGRSSLARLLHARRGVAVGNTRPPLTERQILAWADAFHARTGTWPRPTSGAVAEAPGETWGAVEAALHRGGRGLPEGSSLARLLARARGARRRATRPALTEQPILAWADAHHGRTGAWPVHTSGAIAEAPGETWAGVQAALRDGRRGLGGGSSLARLLARERGVRRRTLRPRLTERRILRWARALFRRTGRWPTRRSGPVGGAPGESWEAVNSALIEGLRGLPGGASLAQLLDRVHGGKGREA
jgi:hypothetical protein